MAGYQTRSQKMSSCACEGLSECFSTEALLACAVRLGTLVENRCRAGEKTTKSMGVEARGCLASPEESIKPYHGYLCLKVQAKSGQHKKGNNLFQRPYTGRRQSCHCAEKRR